MDYAGFVRELERGHVPLIALLHGPEPGLQEDALARLGRLLLPDPSLRALNREVFDAAEAAVAIEDILRSALTLPSLAPARLVIVRQAQALSSARSAPALVEYCRDPSPTTRLVLQAPESLPPTHWLAKALPPAAVVEVRGPTGRSLVAWLQTRAREAGYELSEAAAQLLIRWTGEDLTRLGGELDKACLFRGPAAAGERVLTEEHIGQVVGEHRVLRTFELADAIERRETGRALTLLDGLLAAGEEPLAVLGALTRQVRALWQVAEWRRQGRSFEEIGRLIRRPPFAVQSLAGRAASSSRASLWRALAGCWETERRLKSGGLPRPELTLLVADLCRAG